MESVSKPSPEDIAWAAKAYHSGRQIDFIASVLGVKPRLAFKLIKESRAPKPKFLCAEPPSVSLARQVAEEVFAKTIAPPRKVAGPYVSKLDQYRVEDEEGVFLDKPQTPSDRKARAEEISSSLRRRRLLRRFFAKHWWMIWFLRGRGMSGRQLRRIYGHDCLIWSVGGGIDAEIPQ